VEERGWRKRLRGGSSGGEKFRDFLLGEDLQKKGEKRAEAWEPLKETFLGCQVRERGS